VIISNFLKPQAPNSFVTKKFEIGALSASMANKETGGRFAPTAIRMRAIRRASAYPDRKDFANQLGITLSRLSNFENGFTISIEVENRLVKNMPWVSLDWLRNGNEAGLTGAILQRLVPLVAEESDTTAPRSRSRKASGG
jgi:hypothetical protein